MVIIYKCVVRNLISLTRGLYGIAFALSQLKKPQEMTLLLNCYPHHDPIQRPLIELYRSSLILRSHLENIDKFFTELNCYISLVKQNESTSAIHMSLSYFAAADSVHETWLRAKTNAIQLSGSRLQQLNDCSNLLVAVLSRMTVHSGVAHLYLYQAGFKAMLMGQTTESVKLLDAAISKATELNASGWANSALQLKEKLHLVCTNCLTV